MRARLQVGPAHLFVVRLERGIDAGGLEDFQQSDRAAAKFRRCRLHAGTDAFGEHCRRQAKAGCLRVSSLVQCDGRATGDRRSRERVHEDERAGPLVIGEAIKSDRAPQRDRSQNDVIVHAVGSLDLGECLQIEPRGHANR